MLLYLLLFIFDSGRRFTFICHAHFYGTERIERDECLSRNLCRGQFFCDNFMRRNVQRFSVVERRLLNNLCRGLLYSRAVVRWHLNSILVHGNKIDICGGYVSPILSMKLIIVHLVWNVAPLS